MTKKGELLMMLIESDEEFEKKFLECKDTGEVKKLTLEYNLELSDEDLDFSIDKEELDVEELEAVAGGKACVCVLGGGGEADRKGQGTCACVGAGWGKVDYSCKLSAIQSTGQGYQEGGYMRCCCCGGGGGKDHDFDDATRIMYEQYLDIRRSR